MIAFFVNKKINVPIYCSGAEFSSGDIWFETILHSTTGSFFSKRWKIKLIVKYNIGMNLAGFWIFRTLMAGGRGETRFFLRVTYPVYRGPFGIVFRLEWFTTAFAQTRTFRIYRSVRGQVVWLCTGPIAENCRNG